MKKIQIVCSGIVLVVISSLAQAVELSLNTSDGRSGELKDGTKVATGRIICRGTYTSFHTWMNSRQMGNIPGHYIILGRHDSHNEMRVRLDGAGWLPSVSDGQGMVSTGIPEQHTFDVVIDGNQRLGPDEYILSVSGECS
ncbi:adhesin [Escherichia coli]|nr:adhesin [Escherichia coli]